MKRPASVLILVGFVMLFLGWSIGSFFTQRTVAKTIASIPGSPIVMDAKYVEKKHTVSYSILNPGGMPLTIVEEAFVFTPGKESKEKSYVVSHIPTHTILPPGTVTQVELKLKEGTEKLRVGDIILATFSYIHPLSGDIYNVVHSFTMGTQEKKTSKQKREESK